MDAVCLFVAGALAARLAAPEFTLAWTHSVEKTRWVERYRVDRGQLQLVEATVEGSGAGMEPAPDAVLDNGVWRWRPEIRVPEVTMRRSGFAGDYVLCSGGRCTPMDEIAGPPAPDAMVTIRPCASAVP